jgi:hypothetical protein
VCILPITAISQVVISCCGFLSSITDCCVFLMDDKTCVHFRVPQEFYKLKTLNISNRKGKKFQGCWKEKHNVTDRNEKALCILCSAVWFTDLCKVVLQN